MLDKRIKSLIVSPAQIALDQQMVAYDLWGTQAHVCMLHRSGIVSRKSAALILRALLDLELAAAKGEFKIDPDKGAQLTLEAQVIERAGQEAGLCTHTARSRNDQIMVTELLFLREQALRIGFATVEVLKALHTLAAQHVTTPMPGYTHMQPGKPTTFAHWCLCYFDSLGRGLGTLLQVYDTFDQNPLGSVESFGTSWPIDRAYTARLLGFSRVWEVPQDAISHRGYFQLNLLHALTQLALSISKLSTDLMLYSTFEYAMVDFGDEVAQRLHPITGSSVMAQKRNPDALELTRSLAPQLSGLYHTVAGVLDRLPSGYNRDSREVKEYISLGLEKVSAALDSIRQVVSTIVVNKTRMLELVQSNYSMTTDLADYLAQKTGRPYRLMYKIVGKVVDAAMNAGTRLNDLSLEDLRKCASEHGVELDLSPAELTAALDPIHCLAKRKHVGGTDPEQTRQLLHKRLQQLSDFVAGLESRETVIESARKLTLDETALIIGQS